MTEFLVIIMNVEITEKRENKLLGRTEIEALVTYENVTPKRKEMKELVCTTLGFNPENAVLRKVETQFGVKKAKVLVHAYPSKDKMMKTEPLYILVREGLAEKKKKEKKAKAAAPAAQKK